MRLPVLFLLGVMTAAVAAPAGARAEVATPYPGTVVVDTAQPFAAFLAHLKKAIADNKMGIVAEACADCGAKAIGVTIPGNRVVMVFHPRFAVRMLKASVPAGIEAPIRLYVTERPHGTRLTYRKPSALFAPYRVPALDTMAQELDGIFAKIVAEATGKDAMGDSMGGGGMKKEGMAK